MKYELTVNFDVFENVYIDKERDIYKIGLTITPASET